MPAAREGQRDAVRTLRRIAGCGLLLAVGLLGGSVSGCASLTNPVANGIPVRRLPPELLAGPSRESMQTIPLTLLRQKPPPVYRLAPHDVLGIYIDGVLPARVPQHVAENPPVFFPSQIDPLARGLPPALGYPVPVREDGRISLPMLDPLAVEDRSIPETADLIRRTYVDKGILQAGRERIFVSLMQPRMTRVTVIRQETGGFTTGGLGGIVSASNKRGTGHVVSLRAYENDVLTALAETGGLPGLDAYDEILIFKRADGDAAIVPTLESLPRGKAPLLVASLCPRVIQIPVRAVPHQPLPFRLEDIVLESGDVVFLEARAAELFYTAGLLPAGEHVLPRDYDLDVVEAIARVQGSLVNGGFSATNNVGVLTQRGMGNPNPSLLTVLRRTPGGGQVPIRVDLNRALRDPRERILVRAGDVLILQETPGEAVARYFTDAFRLNIVSQIITSSTTTGTAALVTPTPATF